MIAKNKARMEAETLKSDKFNKKTETETSKLDIKKRHNNIKKEKQKNINGEKTLTFLPETAK